MNECSFDMLMKHTTYILLALLLWSPLLVPAQGTSLTSSTTTVGTSPVVINTGFDDDTNQVYILWDQPVRKVDLTKPADGFTLFINNVQRPIVNHGGEVSSLAVESYVSPIGLDIKPTDTIKLSYNAGTNPIIGRDSGLRATPLSVIEVTNGTSRDTTCPQLQPRLIKTDPAKNLMITYLNERTQRGETAFAEYGSPGTIRIGSQTVSSDITITLGSNIATRILQPQTLDWSQPINITIDSATTLADLSGNLACPGTVTMSTGVQPPATAQNPVPVAPPQQSTSTPTPITTSGPQIVSFEVITAGTPLVPGSTLELQATVSQPVDSTSVVLVELNNGLKKVSLKPASDGSRTLRGTSFITQNMVSASPLKVSRIVSIKLIDNANTTSVNTSPVSPLTNPQSPEYANNIAESVIITVQTK